jgi:hypothetical protein
MTQETICLCKTDYQLITALLENAAANLDKTVSDALCTARYTSAYPALKQTRK